MLCPRCGDLIPREYRLCNGCLYQQLSERYPAEFPAGAPSPIWDSERDWLPPENNAPAPVISIARGKKERGNLRRG